MPIGAMPTAGQQVFKLVKKLNQELKVNTTCGACHLGGITKTNPNVGLDPEALSLATPITTELPPKNIR